MSEIEKSQAPRAPPQQQQQQQSPAAPPFTPRRPSISSPSRLSLQMPGNRGSPTAPILDPALGYSVARRPRLDFARACTSLHHSTLAEKSSPESSPQSGGGAASNSNSGVSAGSIGRRAGGAINDSPIGNHHLQSSSYNFHTTFPSSTTASVDGSVADNDSSSTDEDDDYDLDLMAGSTAQTPITNLNSNFLFRPQVMTDTSLSSSPSLMNSHQAIQAAALIRNPKSRLRLKSRNSSSSASASNSALASPSPTTPPAASGGPMNNGYFARSELGKRRDSLSQALKDSFSLNASGKSDEDRVGSNEEANDAVKRVVTRRGNLLPKTKNFQRIKAALLEESSPIDIEVKREAEVTRQLREEDDAQSIRGPNILHGQLLSLQQTLEPEEIDDTPGEDESMGGESGVSRRNSISGGSGSGGDISMGFSKRAQMFGGAFSFGLAEGVSPPKFPQQQPVRMNSDGDVVMQSDSGSPAVSSPVAPVELRKRRRTQEERFEAPSSFKRRAVSPGVCASPVLTGSPSSNSTGGGGSGGGGGGGGGKRLFGQGMSDTHDGIMKMSLS